MQIVELEINVKRHNFIKNLYKLNNNLQESLLKCMIINFIK